MARRINDTYDIGAAFAAIEDELIASMMRNMQRHRDWEDADGFHWSQWQAEQLQSLAKYRKANQKKFGKQFKGLNDKIDALIRLAHDEGGMDQEKEILQAIKDGFKGFHKAAPGATAEFFRLNDRKLESLIKATTNDMQKAETAVLRMANDQYRKVIYNAQVYANTGAGTYERAVDMATKDMLSTGLNCIEYANGARHTLSDYADMAIRTASKRAYLQGEGEKRQEWGIGTVIMNKRGNPCPKCLPWVGKVLIDDVWSGGSRKDGPYPLMSTAIGAGLYHPRCKDSHTTYFPGISTADDTWTRKEIETLDKSNRQETERQNAKRKKERFNRLSRYSLDADNRKSYQKKSSEWSSRVASLSDNVIIKERWSEEAIASRIRDEKILQGYKIEHAVLYNSNGEQIFHKQGEKHSVGFTSEEIKMMRGGSLTHNHPQGATLSGADIDMLRLSGLQEIRAVGKNGIYVMRQPNIWPEEIGTIDKIETAYAEIQEFFKEEMYELYSSGKITDEETYNIVYQDKIMSAFAKKFELDYEMEEWK